MAYAHASLAGGALDVLSHVLKCMISTRFPQVFVMVKVRFRVSFVPACGSGRFNVGFLVHVKS